MSHELPGVSLSCQSLHLQATVSVQSAAGNTECVNTPEVTCL